jgi:hypothetical protein
MSMYGSQASMAQNHLNSPIGFFLTGNEMDMQLTFFKGESDPYAQFATNWVQLNFSATNMESGASGNTTTSAEMQRSGDMLCHAFLVITAPAIANVTASAITQLGAAGGSIRTLVHTGTGNAGAAGPITSEAHVVYDDNALANAGLWAGGVANLFLIGDHTYKVHAGDGVAVAGSVVVTDTDTTDADTGGDIANTHEDILNYYRKIASATYSSANNCTTVVMDSAITFAASVSTPTAFTATFTHQPQNVLGSNSGRILMNAYSDPNLGFNKTRTAGPTGTPANTTTGIVPSVPILDPNQVHAHYGTYAPCTLVNYLEVVIGSNPLSKVTGLVMQANCELWVASDRLPRRAVNKSSDPAEKGAWALHRQTWAVPVPFWFNQGGYHSSLALCALSFHSIQFNLVLNPYTRTIVNGCGGDFTANTITAHGSGGNVALATKAGALSQIEGDHVHDLFGGTSAPVSPTTTLAGSQFGFYLLLELIYLSDDERDTYTDMTDEVLITQFQYASQKTLSAASQSVEMDLKFNHPVSQVVVAGQLLSNQNDNRWGEFEGPTHPLSISATNPEGSKSHWMKTMQITFNNTARTAAQPAWFFHETVPSVNAERCPDHHFYLYSFGLTSPNGSGQFSGGADFSRLDSASATIVASPQVFKDQSHVGGLDGATTTAATANSITGGQQIYINAFGVNANVAKFENGLVGVCFM